MSKVYILTNDFDYEGTSILGVFESRERALQQATELFVDEEPDRWVYRELNTSRGLVCEYRREEFGESIRVREFDVQ